MKDKNFNIRTMTPGEVSIAIDWAAQEGWNPGLHDAHTYYAADPNGFFIGTLHDEPIATIAAIKYGTSFGFIGLYIVKPDFRGKTYGVKIGKVALAYLEGRNIGVDGVVEKQDNYKAFGFTLAHRNIRYEGRGGGTPLANANSTPLSTLPFETIDAYVRPFFLESRSHFVKAWINQPDAHALGILQNANLAGCGVIRACRVGYKIGPLYADTPELAQSLFLSLKSKAKSTDPIFLDVPQVNPSAVALAERYDMKISFETARMYTGPFPKIPLNQIFGITSFEIG